MTTFTPGPTVTEKNDRTAKVKAFRERWRRQVLASEALANPAVKSGVLQRMEHALLVLGRIVLGDNKKDAEAILAVYLKLEKEIDEWDDDLRVRIKKRLDAQFPGMTPAKRRKAWNKMGDQPVVYFIKAGDFIKIGKSTSWRDRLAAIQTGSPHTVVPLLVLPAGRKTEHQLHVLFDKHQVKGEWFNPAPEIMAYIEEHKAESLLPP